MFNESLPRVIGFTDPFVYHSKSTGDECIGMNVSLSYKNDKFHGVRAETVFLRLNDISDYDWLELDMQVIPVCNEYKQIYAVYKMGEGK